MTASVGPSSDAHTVSGSGSPTRAFSDAARPLGGPVSAFLLGLPITLAAGLLQARTLIVAPPAGEGPGVILLGIVTSFVAGLAAIRFLVAYLQRRTLLVFVIYRIVLGVLLLALARG